MTTAVERRRQKKNRLLSLVRRRAPVGRLALARLVPWSTSSVCDLVQEMIDENLLLEELNGAERRGRLPVPLRVNPNVGRFIGFDLEAMRMRLVCVDFAGQVCWRIQENLRPNTKEGPVEKALDFVETGVARARNEGVPLLGIGLAAPGICDARQGMILHYDLLPELRLLPWRDRVASRTGLPCVMDNNIRAYTLAEWRDGAGRHLTDFICAAVRSGVGAGLVVNGRLLRGSHGFAGEAGYAMVPGRGPLDEWRTLQQMVSERALGVDMESGEGDLSESRARRAGELLGSYLAGLASLLDPQAIILAGGLLRPEGPLWRHVDWAFRRHVLPDIEDRVSLVPSHVGPFAAAIGITEICFDTLYPTGTHY